MDNETPEEDLDILDQMLKTSYRVFYKSPAGDNFLRHLDTMIGEYDRKAEAAETSSAELKYLHNAQAYKTIRAYIESMVNEPSK